LKKNGEQNLVAPEFSAAKLSHFVKQYEKEIKAKGKKSGKQKLFINGLPAVC
jgi:hypothetical protein